MNNDKKKAKQKRAIQLKQLRVALTALCSNQRKKCTMKT